MARVISSASSPELQARHPGVRELIPYFEYEHLSPDLRETSELFAHLAYDLVNQLPDSAELTFSLRQLLLSKDAAVRCRVSARKAKDELEVERCPVGGSHPGHEWHLGNPSGSLFQIPPTGTKLVWCRGEMRMS